MRLLAILALALMAGCAQPNSGGGTLTYAEPQPDPATLAPGLGVRYAYPADVRTLAEAKRMRGVAQEGPPLASLNFPDTKPGENALTSNQIERVIAFIDGYIFFDAPGGHTVKFWSNDGLEVRIGGAPVYLHDRRHTCQSLGPTSFSVPKAGWYKFEAVFFQRLNTSCLIANWTSPGGAAPKLAHVKR